MADDFDEVQFPTGIAYGSAGGPEFSTEIVTLASGHEQRNQNWTYPRERWDVGVGIKELVHLQTVLEFFMARRGMAIGFRFKNHADYEGTAEECEQVEGEDDQWQLMRNYTSGSRTLARKITKPVAGTVTVYVDDVEESAVSVDTTTGIITFETGSEPSTGETVTADFKFDIPVRFDTDHMSLRLADYDAGEATLPIRELRQ